jgi:acyl dehydratase
MSDEFAKSTIFGVRVMHGLWSTGLISAVLGTRLPGPGTIYLSQNLEFLKPVFIGDEVTATVELFEDLGKGRWRVSTICNNQSGDIVLDGVATILFHGQNEDPATQR